jgi:hypothetical protein
MSSQAPTKHSSFWLFGRSLMPSTTSLMVGFLLALAIIVAHIIIMTLNQEAPQLLDEHARQAYNSSVVDPLLRIVNNTTVNNTLGIVLWGIFGYMLYALITFVVSDLSEWRIARQEVRIAGGSVVRSPMHRSLLARVGWRLGIGIAFVLFTLIVMPITRHALMNDYSVLWSPTVSDSGLLVLQSLGIWMLILHGYTVLLRLYMMRTRVFGEIIY